MNKPVKVILLDEADKEYRRLNEIIGKQIKEGKEKAEPIKVKPNKNSNQRHQNPDNNKESLFKRIKL